jgi:hypothetical protein
MHGCNKHVGEAGRKNSCASSIKEKSSAKIDHNPVASTTTASRRKWLSIWESTPLLEDFNREYHILDNLFVVDSSRVSSHGKGVKCWRYEWASLPESIAHIPMEDEIEIDL